MKQMLISLFVITMTVSGAYADNAKPRSADGQSVAGAGALSREWNNILVDPVALRKTDEVWGEPSEVHLISLPSTAERGTPVAVWERIFVDPVAERKDALVLARIENSLSTEWKNMLSDSVARRANDDVWGEASEVHIIALPSVAERGTPIAEWESVFIDPVTERKAGKLVATSVR